MLLQLDPSTGLPVYRQIASAVRRAISDGEVSPGERLPGARDLAGALGVNMHTVLRAYGDLRDEGLIELRRGRGAVVRPGSVSLAGVRHVVIELAETASHHGIEFTEIVAMLEEEMT